MRITPPRFLAWIGLLSWVASSAFGQMQVLGTFEGKRLPVVAFKGDALIVLDGTRREQSYSVNDINVRPAGKFAEGFVTISEVHEEKDLLQHATSKELADPSSIRARYRATITADRKLSDCFGLLTFVTQGSIGTRLVKIGRLAEGRPQTIEVEMTNDLNLIGSLHLFSEGEEVHTTLHPSAYDPVKTYADLVKSVKGIPAVELLKLEDHYPHELTPDARRLATIRQHGANKVIFVFDLDHMKTLSETVVCGVDDFAGHLTWISDDQLAYIAAVRDHDYSQALFLLDVNKGTTKKLLDDTYSIIQSLPEHPEILEVMNLRNGSLFMKYNVLTRKGYDYEDPDAGGYYFDAQGKARLMYYYDGARKFYQFRPTPTSRWKDLDDLVKQPGLKFNGKADDALDRIAEVHSVGPDGDTLYISSRLGSDTFQLAAFSMSQGVITRTIARHPKYDLTTTDGGSTRLLFGKNSPQLLGMIYDAQKPQVIWIEPHYAAVQKTVDAAFPDQVNLPVDWSADGATFIYFSFSDRDPGTYYLYQARTGVLMPLMQLAAQLNGKALGETKPVEITARDGHLIPGYVTSPPETEGKLPPLLVVIHGGPMARDSWGFDATNQFFATRGYKVLQVNYRGSSGFGAAFQNAGLRARLDTVVLDDIADGVRELIAQHQVDPNRIAVMGGSFGGWATYMCLAKYPDLFRTGIAIAAVTSWKKAQSDDRWTWGKEYGYAFWKALLEKQDYAANAKYLDPLLRVAEIKQPVFVIHGELDRVVHPTEARLMLDALKKQGATVEAKSFLHSGHSNWSFDDRVEMLNEIAAFLERNLPAGAK